MSNKPFNTTGSPNKDSNGRWITRALFFELNDTPDIPPRFTLRDQDIDTPQGVMVSAKRLYLESMDPTEYTQAYLIAENWDHWQKLLKSSGIGEEIEKWRNELEVKIRSRAIREVMASDKAADHKWLADRGWKLKKVGRPSREEKIDEQRANKELQADLDRMRGTLN